MNWDYMLQGKQVYEGTEPIPVIGDGLLGSEFWVIGKKLGPEYGNIFMVYAPKGAESLVYPSPLRHKAEQALEEVRRNPSLSDVDLYRMRLRVEKVE